MRPRMVGALGGHEILHIAANHIIRAARSALSKKGKVGPEVALVRRDGVGGQIALDRQVIQVFASTRSSSVTPVRLLSTRPL